MFGYEEKTWKVLTDNALYDIFRQQKCYDDGMKMLEKHLDKKSIDNIKNDKEFILKYFIKAGTKGVIRGNKFNELIVRRLHSIIHNTPYLELYVEKQHRTIKNNEKPDWYIEDKQTGKVLFGYNQIDLCGGGAQLNRASKYILSNNDTTSVKYIYTIAKKYNGSIKSKYGKIHSYGIENDKLCYIGDLRKQIYNFFHSI